jgi:hypothetical protein
MLPLSESLLKDRIEASEQRFGRLKLGLDQKLGANMTPKVEIKNQ